MFKVSFKHFFVLLFFIFSLYTTNTSRSFDEKKPYFGCVLYRKAMRQNRSDAEYLLLQNNYGLYRWSLLKGFVKHFVNQTPEEFIIKRLQYILGVNESIFRIMPGFTTQTEFTTFNRTKNGTYYLVELIKPALSLRSQLESLRFKDYAWLSYDAAFKIIQFPDMQALLTACNTFLRKIGLVTTDPANSADS